MIAVTDILKKADYSRILGDENTMISEITFDSRKVIRGSLFIAFKGTQVDGHDFINKAIENGAVAIVCEILPSIQSENIVFIVVNDSQKALAQIASNFYANPSESLVLIGITGTNGKTTIATVLYELFNSLGHKSGLLSTVENYIGNKKIEATHTTPDPIQLNALLKQMVDKQCKYCFIEVSSHAVDQKRIEALDFDGGVFTNITHDHLDYHKTFKDDINAKKGFFDGLKKSAFALVNSDDKNAKVMLQNTSAKKLAFGLKSAADFNCKILEHHFDGMLLQFNKIDVWTQFIGEFNASNLLAVFAVANLLGINKEETLTEISKLKPVRGRLETLRSENSITAIVDYAHTPDALSNVLQTIAKIRKKHQQIITVVGAGGNRDKDKRPLMAKNALFYSDKLILTSDNPRDEDPMDILHDMEKGIELNSGKAITIVDRKQAIKTACMLANKGDIILVAGKGHETYQEIKGEKYPFDDIEILSEFLNIN